MMVNYSANFKGLNDLKNAFKENLVVKVGILAGQNTRDDTATNAAIGAVHEFGSFTKNIPARSWLRMPIQAKKKEIQADILNARKRIGEELLDGSSLELYNILGLSAEKAIQGAFETNGYGKWKANSPSTVKQKGSSSTLIDTGQLRGAVLSKVVKVNG